MCISHDNVVEAISALGWVASRNQITILDNLADKQDITDVTTKILVPTPTGPGFMIVSSDVNPGLVQRGVDNIRLVKARVGVHCASAILSPILCGKIDGRSFAIWERHRPLLSGKGSKRFNRYFYGPRIIDWAYLLCAHSLKPAANVPKQFVVPLQAVRDEAAFPKDMRQQAGRALDRLDEWRPLQCIQHGDFWEGNVLRSRQDGGLFVIDWAGARENGYPVVDILQMLMSIGCSRRAKDRQIERLCGTLACSRDDLTSYTLAALGYLGANLEYFPVEKYYQISVSVFRYISQK